MLAYELTPEQVRILGCLIEKEMATPEYYPLTLNALVNGCNQKTNRNPVVAYDENTVLAALEALKENHLAWQSNAARVPKYEQHLDKSMNLVPREMSLICLLLLRGPQTAGELRSRSERLYSFASLEEVNEILAELEERGLVRQLPRQPGQKEVRYIHLLSGEPEEEQVEGTGYSVASESKQDTPSNEDRFAALEDETRRLRAELHELKEMFMQFKGQFE
mgnify:CR=1 FL=1